MRKHLLYEAYRNIRVVIFPRAFVILIMMKNQ